MSRTNPHIRRRRVRGTGGLYRRRGKWIASWVERGRKRTKVFNTRSQAESWLAFCSPTWRDIWLNELRGLLWAELHARLRFGSAEIVSNKARKIA